MNWLVSAPILTMLCSLAVSVCGCVWITPCCVSACKPSTA